MCEFFSFNTNGRGKFWYFKPKDITKVRKGGNPTNLNFNSHASIASYYKFDEDKSNKYEYDPYTKGFKVDQINTRNDRESAEKWVKELFPIDRKKFLGFCRNYFYKIDYNKIKKQLGNIPTKSNVINHLKRVETIDWFKPINPTKTFKSQLQLKVNDILSLFKIDFKVNIEIKSLNNPKDWDAAWDAARDAARDAAWGAARGAAWGASFEVSADLIKDKYKSNPFSKLLDLWEMGLYPCGLIKKKFVIYYVPKSKGG